MMEIIEFHADQQPANINIVPLKQWLIDHKKRILFRTSKGDLVLKRITQLDVEETVLRFTSERSEYIKMSNQASALWAISKAGGELNDEQIAQLNALSAKLQPFVRAFALSCFVEPKITTIDEYDALITQLQEGERKKLYELMIELQGVQFEGKQCALAPQSLMLIKDYDLKPSDLTLETITAAQTAALTNAEIKQVEQVKQQIERQKNG